MVRIFPELGKIGKNADQNNSEYGHFFRYQSCFRKGHTSTTFLGDVKQ